MEIPTREISREDAEALAKLWDKGLNVSAQTTQYGLEVKAWQKGTKEPLFTKPKPGAPEIDIYKYYLGEG